MNVVEEMELNLFPDSQKNVLYELIADAYKLSGNRLLMTTHSPYVINYLALAVKARQLADKAIKTRNCWTVYTASFLRRERSMLKTW